MIYSWCTFLDCYRVFSLLQAYSRKWGSPGFRKTTLGYMLEATYVPAQSHASLPLKLTTVKPDQLTTVRGNNERPCTKPCKFAAQAHHRETRSIDHGLRQ
jgi:hypothetical protein